MHAIDVKLLELVTHKTEPLKLVLSHNHHEYLKLFVISSPLTPLILGIPWLKTHNPHMDWAMATIRHLVPARSCGPAQSPDSDLTHVTPEYHELRRGFSKTSACTLTPHKPHDRSIDLLPGSPLPTKRLYNLSKPDREAMEKYIT